MSTVRHDGEADDDNTEDTLANLRRAEAIAATAAEVAAENLAQVRAERVRAEGRRRAYQRMRQLGWGGLIKGAGAAVVGCSIGWLARDGRITLIVAGATAGAATAGAVVIHGVPLPAIETGPPQRVPPQTRQESTGMNVPRPRVPPQPAPQPVRPSKKSTPTTRPTGPADPTGTAPTLTASPVITPTPEPTVVVSPPPASDPAATPQGRKLKKAKKHRPGES